LVLSYGPSALGLQLNYKLFPKIREQKLRKGNGGSSSFSGDGLRGLRDVVEFCHLFFSSRKNEGTLVLKQLGNRERKDRKLLRFGREEI
jgi:hypothetical protein